MCGIRNSLTVLVETGSHWSDTTGVRPGFYKRVDLDAGFAERNAREGKSATCLPECAVSRMQKALRLTEFFREN
jgi:hypothetical protein